MTNYTQHDQQKILENKTSHSLKLSIEKSIKSYVKSARCQEGIYLPSSP